MKRIEYLGSRRVNRRCNTASGITNAAANHSGSHEKEAQIHNNASITSPSIKHQPETNLTGYTSPHNPMPELAPVLKQLRLSGILERIERRNREAIEHKMSYPEFLTIVIQDEAARENILLTQHVPGAPLTQFSDLTP